MTEYKNPQIPEGINVSKDHPLKEFAWLVAAVSGIFIVFSVTLILLVGFLVRFVPFSVELKLANGISNSVESTDQPLSADAKTIENYLQTLADQLAAIQQLPDEMSLSIHYVEEDLVNAFATLGGNILIYRGLLEAVDSENGLAMVMAHEIAHIKHRDPVVALGRGVALGIALASIAGLGNNDSVMGWLGQLNTTTTITFVRSQENAADLEALETLKNYYGHAFGADELFVALSKEDSEFSFDEPEWLRTHPLDESRINRVKEFNQQFGQAELKPLPAFIAELAEPADNQ